MKGWIWWIKNDNMVSMYVPSPKNKSWSYSTSAQDSCNTILKIIKMQKKLGYASGIKFPMHLGYKRVWGHLHNKY